MDIPKNQSWVSLHPLSSPLHLVLAKPLPAVDPAKGIEQEGILVGGGVVFYCYHSSYGQSYLQ